MVLIQLGIGTRSTAPCRFAQARVAVSTFGKFIICCATCLTLSPRTFLASQSRCDCETSAAMSRGPSDVRGWLCLAMA